MINRIRSWYRSWSDRARAAWRTAYMATVAALGTLVVALFAEAVDILNGGTLADSVSDASVALKTFLIVFVGAASGFVSYVINGNGRAPHYDNPGDPQE